MQSIIEKMAVATLPPDRQNSIVLKCVVIAQAERAWETYARYCQH